jgi:crotonobetainyl-CoA:carnitine CoA-transferase CaiB-like acyl-CoA transferase
MGNAHMNIVPYHVFRARDAFLIVAVGNDGQFAKFCEVIGAPEWPIDPRFASNPARVRHRELLVELITGKLAARDAADWLRLLEPAGVPCGPINDLRQVFDDPQVRHRGLQVRAPHAVAGEVTMVANPMRFSETPITYEAAPPVLGEHTEQVLREVLGLEGAKIDQLRQEKVV